MTSKRMAELRYRASRICQVLGNPATYEILHLLKKGKRTPGQLADALGTNISHVSKMLRALRQVDLVRYDVEWRARYYWIKTEAARIVLQNLERLVRDIAALK